MGQTPLWLFISFWLITLQLTILISLENNSPSFISSSVPRLLASDPIHPTMKQQRITQFYQTTKKIKDLLKMKLPCFKNKCKTDKERSKSHNGIISKISRSKKLEEQKKSSQDLNIEVFNESLGPDFKIYEFDDFLVNSSPVAPPPPLPPRYSASCSVPPPVSRRTSSYNYN